VSLGSPPGEGANGVLASVTPEAGPLVAAALGGCVEVIARQGDQLCPRSPLRGQAKVGDLDFTESLRRLGGSVVVEYDGGAHGRQTGVLFVAEGKHHQMLTVARNRERDFELPRAARQCSRGEALLVREQGRSDRLLGGRVLERREAFQRSLPLCGGGVVRASLGERGTSGASVSELHECSFRTRSVRNGAGPSLPPLLT